MSSLWRSLIAVRGAPAPSLAQPGLAGAGWCGQCTAVLLAADWCWLRAADLSAAECGLCWCTPCSATGELEARLGCTHLHSSTPARHRRVSARSTGGCSHQILPFSCHNLSDCNDLKIRQRTAPRPAACWTRPWSLQHSADNCCSTITQHPPVTSSHAEHWITWNIG